MITALTLIALMTPLPTAPPRGAGTTTLTLHMASHSVGGCSRTRVTSDTKGKLTLTIAGNKATLSASLEEYSSSMSFSRGRSRRGRRMPLQSNNSVSRMEYDLHWGGAVTRVSGSGSRGVVMLALKIKAASARFRYLARWGKGVGAWQKWGQTGELRMRCEWASIPVHPRKPGGGSYAVDAGETPTPKRGLRCKATAPKPHLPHLLQRATVLSMLHFGGGVGFKAHTWKMNWASQQSALRLP